MFALEITREARLMEAVKVGVCIRSLTKDEKSKNLKNATRVDGNQLKIRFGDGREKTFTWDYGVCILSLLSMGLT